MYLNNDQKFVAVLNRKIDTSRLMNALGHMTAGITSEIGIEAPRFLRYLDADGTAHPGISTYPFIVLRAENSNQIRNLRSRAIEAGLAYTDFVDAMLGSSAEDQLARTKARRESELEYFGILLFGSAEELSPLTKRFSIFTDPKPSAMAESASTPST